MRAKGGVGNTGGVTLNRSADRRRWLVLVALGLYAGGASLTRPHTGAATLAVVLPAAVVLVRAGTRHPSGLAAADAHPSLRRTAWAWAAVVVSTAVWELAAWLQQPAYNVASEDHPTVSILLDPLTDATATRLLAWYCWLYLGYRMARR